MQNALDILLAYVQQNNFDEQTNKQLVAALNDIGSAYTHQQARLAELAQVKLESWENISAQMHQMSDTLLQQLDSFLDSELGELNEEQIKWTESIHRQFQYNKRITHAIFELTQVKLGKINFTLKRVPIKDLLEDVANFRTEYIDNFYKNEPHAGILNISSDLDYLVCDDFYTKQLLRFVFSYYLDNFYRLMDSDISLTTQKISHTDNVWIQFIFTTQSVPNDEEYHDYYQKILLNDGDFFEVHFLYNITCIHAYNLAKLMGGSFHVEPMSEGGLRHIVELPLNP